MGGHPFLEFRTKVFWGRKCCYPASSSPPRSQQIQGCFFMAAPFITVSFSYSHTSSEVLRIPFLRCIKSVHLSSKSAVRRSKNVPEGQRRLLWIRGNELSFEEWMQFEPERARHILCVCATERCVGIEQRVCAVGCLPRKRPKPLDPDHVGLRPLSVWRRGRKSIFI